MKNTDSDNLRDLIEKEVLFTGEACRILGISAQRLHQLVQTGKLKPIKSNPSGTLFLRKDIEDRKSELEKNMPSDSGLAILQSDSTIVQRAINYFTIQHLCKHSFKKAVNYFTKYESNFSSNDPLIKNNKDVATSMDLTVDSVQKAYSEVIRGFETLKADDVIAAIDSGYMYPQRLSITDNAPLFLFMRGNPLLAQLPIVAIVGTRKPTSDGIEKSRTLAALLGKHQIVVASGLASGIDSAAHKGALETKNPTIAVIGTPLSRSYPKENSAMQEQIASEGLVISQFPPSASVQRWNFPMRNAVMSGISLATVIIEAGETSGALIQANYALKQGRFVFIPQSAIDNPRLKWPQKYISRPGAASFSKVSELVEKLQSSDVIASSTDNVYQESFFAKQVSTYHVRRD